MTRQLRNILRQAMLITFLFCLSTKLYGIDPVRDYILTPEALGVDFETMLIKTTDNFYLNTWVYYPEKGKDNNFVLILAYPDKGNMSYFVYHAATFAARGFTVVTFDYRGFGKSSDFKINREYLYHTEFTNDLTAVAKGIDSKFPRKKIGVWAMSMGTIIVTRSIERISGHVDFIIGEGFITNTSKVVDRIAEQKNKVIHLPESSEKYQKSLRMINIPLLIFSASNDQIATVDDSLNLKMAKGGDTEVVVYQGGHLTGFQAGNNGFGQFYIDEVNKFLNKSL